MWHFNFVVPSTFVGVVDVNLGMSAGAYNSEVKNANQALAIFMQEKRVSLVLLKESKLMYTLRNLRPVT
jgi:hypothetical protein